MAETVSAETSRRILDAAALLLGERPMRSLQVQEIAVQAGVSTSAIYKAYANKYELFAYAAESVLADQVHRVAEAVDETAPPLDILRGVLADFCELARGHPYAASYVFAAIPLVHHDDIPDDDVLRRTTALGRRARERLGGRIIAAVDRGELTGDPDRLTDYAMIATFGYVGLVSAGAIDLEPATFAAMTVTALQALDGDG